MKDQKKVEYHGWANVPSGVLVKAKTKEKEGGDEFYIKLDGFKKMSLVPGEDTFLLTHLFNPDTYTTGVYKAVPLK